jgi:DNA-binding transcriptional ArsR family regulator
MDAVLAAIAEPNRRAILQLVGEREMAAGEIAGHFAVTRPAVSQHLSVLKDVGLLVERREGTRRLYRLEPDGLAELRAFLAELWPDALLRFKSAAEARAPGASESSASLGASTQRPRRSADGKRHR